MGKHMKRLLLFCIKYPGWQSIAKNDPPMRRAVDRLVAIGAIERNEFGQVRLALAQWARDNLELGQ